ncbi:hypothetical protein BC828DRAFT_374158, partial [Blastocladiella britannica]
MRPGLFSWPIRSSLLSPSLSSRASTTAASTTAPTITTPWSWQRLPTRFLSLTMGHQTTFSPLVSSWIPPPPPPPASVQCGSSPATYQHHHARAYSTDRPGHSGTGDEHDQHPSPPTTSHHHQEQQKRLLPAHPHDPRATPSRARAHPFAVDLLHHPPSTLSSHVSIRDWRTRIATLCHRLAILTRLSSPARRRQVHRSRAAAGEPYLPLAASNTQTRAAAAHDRLLRSALPSVDATWPGAPRCRREAVALMPEYRRAVAAWLAVAPTHTSSAIVAAPGTNSSATTSAETSAKVIALRTWTPADHTQVMAAWHLLGVPRAVLAAYASHPAPDVGAFNLALKAAASGSDSSSDTDPTAHVLQLLSQRVESGRELDAFSIATVATAVERAGRPADALSLVQGFCGPEMGSDTMSPAVAPPIVAPDTYLTHYARSLATKSLQKKQYKKMQQQHRASYIPSRARQLKSID